MELTCQITRPKLNGRLSCWPYGNMKGRLDGRSVGAAVHVKESEAAGRSLEGILSLGGTFQLQLRLTLNGSSFQAGTARQSAHSNRSRREIMNTCHICCDFDVSLECKGAGREVRSPSLRMSVKPREGIWPLQQDQKCAQHRLHVKIEF